jgi:predicted RNA-binding protein with PUA-like domain
MRVIESRVVDPTQFDPNSPYYDGKSSQDAPRWQTVVVEFVQVFPEMIALDTLKQQFSPNELLVVKKGNRLSVIPIADVVAQRILSSSQGG